MRKSEFAGTLTAAQVGSIYEENRSSLIGFARRWLRDPHRAEEIVQDALIRVILASPEIDSTEHALNYLRKSVQSLCLDQLRIEGSRPRLIALDSQPSFAEMIPSSEPSLHDSLTSFEDAAIVREALSLLSASERAALVMWEVDGRSTKEIASELGIKESSVRHTISRARTSLRRILSELVIDQERGLTAVDLLSRTYAKSKRVAQKSSKVVLSLLLAFVSLMGYQKYIYQAEVSDRPNASPLAEVSNNDILVQTPLTTVMTRSSNNSEDVRVVEKVAVKVSAARATKLTFLGLDTQGVPLSFTITDGNGKLGSLFTSFRPTTIIDDAIVNSGIVKTNVNGPNLLFTQTITHDLDGVKLGGTLAFAIQGSWIPVNLSVISTEIERLATGNYLISAAIQVKSGVDSTISIPASAGGWDLNALPSRVNVKILLSPTKTEVLGEALQVVERSNK